MKKQIYIILYFLIIVFPTHITAQNYQFRENLGNLGIGFSREMNYLVGNGFKVDLDLTIAESIDLFLYHQFTLEHNIGPVMVTVKNTTTNELYTYHESTVASDQTLSIDVAYYRLNQGNYKITITRNILVGQQVGYILKVKAFTPSATDPITENPSRPGDEDNGGNIQPEPADYTFLASNYNRTKTYLNDSGTEFTEQVQYLDGFRRPIQEIAVRISPNRGDIVTPITYGKGGRTEESYLPFPKSGNNGNIISNATDAANYSFYGTDKDHAFSHTLYENMPSEKPVKTTGAGKDWHTNDKSVNYEYGANTANEVKLFIVNESNVLSQNGYYTIGTLQRNIVKDENNNESISYTDRQGRTILAVRKNGTTRMETYFVYNDRGLLAMVLPPEATDRWSSGNNDVLNKYAYQYKYDGWGRMIEKKLPGIDPVYYIYDKADRLIFSQDGEQRLKNEWTFSVPDELGRTILSGICKNTLSHTADPLKSVVAIARWTGGTNIYKGYTITGLTLSSPTILAVNYYDNYTFLGTNGIPNNANTRYNVEAGYGTQGTDGNIGLLTGTLTALLDGSATPAYLYAVMYYDNRGRVVQTKSNNHLAGGVEKNYIAYNFSNQPVLKKHVHSATGKTEQTELYTHEYDHAGRLKKTKHKLNTGGEVTLAENTYDELGRLLTNKKGGNENLKSTYSYNIRSWVKSITGNYFNQTLYYNESYGGSAKQYNGNISAMSWKVQGESNLRGYTFGYDGLSRLTSANYLVNGAANNNFKVQNITYDKHGNMKTLQRYGKTSASAYGLIDNLTMTYTGNQLTKSEDAIATISLTESADFKNYSNVAAEYTYNKNGAMVKDLNKGISDIKYNSLNLPLLMDIKSPVAEARNEYTYTAGGVKLKTVQKWNPNYSTAPVIGSGVNLSALTQAKTTDYVGNKVYEQGTLKRVLVDGGYIENGIYHYHLTDHLGNNRVIANASGTVIQKNHYYPFGMAFAENTVAEQGKQPYKYNGKELDQMHGLNMYDYSARYTMPELGNRFTTVDPHAENYFGWSPYHYGGNNPILNIDPDGLDYWSTNDPGQIHGYETNFEFIDFDLSLWTNHGLNPDNVTGTVWFNDWTGMGGRDFGGGVAARPKRVPMISLIRNSVNRLSELRLPNLSKNERVYSDAKVISGSFGIGSGMFSYVSQYYSNYIDLYNSGKFLFNYNGVTNTRSLKFYGNPTVSSTLLNAQKASSLNKMNLAKGAKVIGNALAVGSVIVDGAGLYNYYKNPESSYTITPEKFGLNTGITIASYWFPGLGITHGIMDNLYPGGWDGWADNMNSLSTYADESTMYGPKL